MYIQNRRNSSKFNGCSPLKRLIGLTGLNPAIAYFTYIQRYIPLTTPDQNLKLFPYMATFNYLSRYKGNV